MNFLALSHAPPPEVIEIATNRPVTITPSNIAPTAEKAAEQKSRHDVRIIQREIELNTLEVRIARPVGDEEFQILVVGGEQNECAQAGRPDGIALGHGFGGIAHGVERIG